MKNSFIKSPIVILSVLLIIISGYIFVRQMKHREGLTRAERAAGRAAKRAEKAAKKAEKDAEKAAKKAEKAKKKAVKDAAKEEITYCEGKER